MNAFDPQVLAADLIEVKRIFASFFAARSQTDWDRCTEKHARGWSLRETIAHLDAVGQAYQQAIEAALAGRPCSIRGAVVRTDLPVWNQREIAERAHQRMSILCDSFLDTLQRAADFVAPLSPDVLTKTTALPFYHRPISIGELVGGQAAHPGIVHAAQVAHGARIAPLWAHFTPALLHRQITRFFHLMSLAYWPERGGSLRATLALSAAGGSGGRWYVTLAPEGSRAGEERIRRPTLRIVFRNADVLCRVFTLQLSPWRALLTTQIVAWGDVRLGFRLGWLFNPA